MSSFSSLGNDFVKRVLTVAAAGGHDILLFKSPSVDAEARELADIFVAHANTYDSPKYEVLDFGVASTSEVRKIFKLLDQKPRKRFVVLADYCKCDAAEECECYCTMSQRHPWRQAVALVADRCGMAAHFGRSESSESYESITRRIAEARRQQKEAGLLNSDVIDPFEYFLPKLDFHATKLLRCLVDKFRFGSLDVANVLRISATIRDLASDSHAKLPTSCLGEAIIYVQNVIDYWRLV